MEEKKYWKLSEVSEMTGLSRKALQEYDRLDMLHPASKTEGGYWLYDETAVNKARMISTFSMAGYKRAEIKNVLDRAEGDNVQILLDNYKTVIERLKAQRDQIDAAIRSFELSDYMLSSFTERIRKQIEYIKSKNIILKQSVTESYKNAFSHMLYMSPEQMEAAKVAIEPTMLLTYMGAYADEDINSCMMKENMEELFEAWDKFIMNSNLPETAKAEFDSLKGHERLCSIRDFIYIVAETKDGQGKSVVEEIEKNYGPGTYEKIKKMINDYLSLGE